jgi:CheY-like chemotaxis protein
MTVILLLEDERAIAELLVDILDEEGYQVVQATNGRDGLQLLDQHPISLIITDLMMPVMTGREFCQHVVARGPHPPIVVLSATAAIHAQSCPGAVAIMGKPFLTEHLLAMVHRLLTDGPPSGRDSGP